MLTKKVHTEFDLEAPVSFQRLMYPDARGFLSEIFRKETLRSFGISCDFVQENYSHSKPLVLRGLHYQLMHPQAKLVTVTRGAVLDVGVDIRSNSKTFGKWYAAQLSAENGLALYWPTGFAHGFAVIEGPADVHYKCSDEYYAEDQFGIRWNDPTLAIDWTVSSPILSEKDANLPLLSEVDPSTLPTT